MKNKKSVVRFSVCPQNLEFSIARMNAIFTRGVTETIELVQSGKLLDTPYISIFENFDTDNIEIYRLYFQYEEAMYVLYGQREARYQWQNVMVKFYKLRNEALKNRTQNPDEKWVMLFDAIRAVLGPYKMVDYGRTLKVMREKLEATYAHIIFHRERLLA
jgi:hypothetical protein